MGDIPAPSSPVAGPQHHFRCPVPVEIILCSPFKPGLPLLTHTYTYNTSSISLGPSPLDPSSHSSYVAEHPLRTTLPHTE
ncbi:hypothetical protein HanRHA438_Chr02g0066181 [Helianthus annuus]|nr:hypothetical protein HanRHA438_Chr02g0066181 [Helianthus annuus]